VNVYPFIEAEQAGRTEGAGNVARACELLEVSRSAYYAHRVTRAAGGSATARADLVLLQRIRTAHTASAGTYGAPRIQHELAEAGHRHGRKRIARLMRTHGLRGRTPRRWRKTTIPDPAAGKRPDLIGGNFAAGGALDTRWCGDITYIRTWEGWLYLATVIDIASRKVVGWATSASLHTDLVDTALRRAVAARRPARGVIFHADRGCQYTSNQLAKTARELGVRLSVGRTGVCWDNALAESWFAAFKKELIQPSTWPTRAAADAAIFDWIEGWYNTRRRHSSLGYRSPARFEQTQYRQAA
jgi:transposase InsO family protein